MFGMVGEHLDEHTELFAVEPSEIFTLTAVISDEEEYGTVVSSTVQERYVNQVGFSKATVRILPISGQVASALWKAVCEVSKRVKHSGVLQYIGVWRCAESGEFWLVSERRRNQVSLKTLFDEMVESNARESVIAYVAQQVLQILQAVHGYSDETSSNGGGMAHGYIRPRCIHVCDDGEICLSDFGIYDVLQEGFRKRRTFPGEKIWDVRGGVGAGRTVDSDVWDVGIALLCALDGTDCVARMWRDGEGTPRLSRGGGTGRYTSEVGKFIPQLFAHMTDSSSRGQEVDMHGLLTDAFVANASANSSVQAVREYWQRRDDGLVDAHVNDLIARLFRRNEVVVRAPLVSVDDVVTDMFDYERWCGSVSNCPTVEQSLVRIVKVCKEQGLTKDVEDVKGRCSAIGDLETFLDTADLL